MSAGGGGAVLAVFVANDGIPILTRTSRNITSSRSGGPTCAATAWGSGSRAHRWRTYNNETPIFLIGMVVWWWFGCLVDVITALTAL